nr:Chain C, SHP NR Box 1 Peptide [Homo sapiens]5UFS_D Chain D, SHP NR Box 1 Peptide [Homo sapiens]
APAILYALLSS